MEALEDCEAAYSYCSAIVNREQGVARGAHAAQTLSSSLARFKLFDRRRGWRAGAWRSGVQRQ
jgi:hypothetical protein